MKLVLNPKVAGFAIYIFIHISNNVKLKIFHSMHSIIVLSFFLFKGYVLYYL